jgi:hypothetical protein
LGESDINYLVEIPKKYLMLLYGPCHLELLVAAFTTFCLHRNSILAKVVIQSMHYASGRGD